MKFTIREPGSALTHLAAVLMVMVAAIPLLVKAGLQGGRPYAAMIVFVVSLILLYGASTTYHTVNLAGRALRVFQKIDHMMIFVLIAGSYTPVTLLVLPRNTGLPLFFAVWGIALAGMVFNICWINCPKWVSSVIYIALGWACLPVCADLYRILSPAAFAWLLAGGLIYTAGGVIYALKLPVFNAKHRYFGSHEIFHLFVMGGSLCHFVFMFRYVL